MDTQVMDVKESMKQAQEALTVKRVFGEPVVRDGITVIPAARVQGAAGGGSGEAPEQGGGSGTGFALNAKPFGVYVIKDGDVVWRPAVDVNRMILGGQIVAIVALLLFRAVVKARAKRELLATAVSATRRQPPTGA
jgi:uncharacterized spore protein YtfJ